MEIVSNKILQWKNITITNQDKTNTILDNLTGELNSKNQLAIMGSSGAGKTTFLNFLSKRKNNTKLKKQSGEIRFIIDSKDESKSLTKLTAFVTQDDILHEVLTVHELLTFAAAIKLINIKLKDREILVNNLIKKLGLELCRNVRVGRGIKGLSSGERKRTAIGYELITNPSIIFLDEPTTGLDARSAYSLITMLTEDAKENNRLIIYTIHQPSSELFKVFDKLLLMAHGKTVFFGKASDSLTFFKSQGFECPINYNPAEYFLKLLSNDMKSNDDETSAIFNKSDDIDNKLVPTNVDLTTIIMLENEANKLINTTDLSEFKKKKSEIKFESHSVFLQLFILLGRNWKIVLRNPNIIYFRLSFYLFGCFLAILAYNNIGKGDFAIYDRNGLIFFITNLIAQSSQLGNIIVFNDEKFLLYKEQINQKYNLTAYFFSKILLEIPLNFLSALFSLVVIYWSTGLNTNDFSKYIIYVFVVFMSGLSSSSLGIAMSVIIDYLENSPMLFPIVMFPMQFASGYFLSQHDLPTAFIPIKYVSIHRYTYQALCWNEYTGIGDLECNDVNKCVLPLGDFGDGLMMSILWLGVLTVVFTFLAMVTLKIKVLLRK